MYAVPSTLFKLSPHFDALITGIINADKRAVIVLIDGKAKGWRDRLLARLCAGVSEASCVSREEHSLRERKLWFTGEQNDRLEAALRVSRYVERVMNDGTCALLVSSDLVWLFCGLECA